MRDCKKANERPEKTDERPKVSLMKVILFGLKVNMKALPVMFICINIVGIFHGVSHGFATYMTQEFYDSVESVLRDKSTLKHAFLMIAALGLACIVRELLNGLHNFMHDIVFGN